MSIFNYYFFFSNFQIFAIQTRLLPGVPPPPPPQAQIAFFGGCPSSSHLETVAPLSSVATS
jgi:hypothetical protein